MRERHEHLCQPTLIVVFPECNLIKQAVNLGLSEFHEPAWHFALVVLHHFLDKKIVRSSKSVTVIGPSIHRPNATCPFLIGLLNPSLLLVLPLGTAACLTIFFNVAAQPVKLTLNIV